MPKEKTRWATWPRSTTVSSKEMAKDLRMDAQYYLAKECLLKMLGELRHDTTPSIEEFMESVDYALDHPRVTRALVHEHET